MRGFIETFDVTHASIGGILMGALIFFINMNSSMMGGTKAAIAQTTISFLIIGTNTGVFKKLCHHTQTCKRTGAHKLTIFRGKALSVIIPTLFTTLVASLIHYATGTPQLLWTILAVFLSGAIHFSLLNIVYFRYGTVDPHQLFFSR